MVILDKNAVVLSKSIALIEKTKLRVQQMDLGLIPTSATRLAIDLLIRTLDELGEPANLRPVDPAVLYNRLINLQLLVDQVDNSSIDHISWPLVSYCDDMWHAFFGSSGPKIFYTVTDEYNYQISHFSNHLRALLVPILSTANIDDIFGDTTLYCLHLASLEDDNLPLYANIGHEFGHAVFDHNESSLLQFYTQHFSSVWEQLFEALSAIDATQAMRRLQRLAFCIRRFLEELFADLVGALLMGPAFFLSLFEMSWGANSTGMWSVELSPDDSRIQAYPSFDFRLSCINGSIKLDEFADRLSREIELLADEKTSALTLSLSGSPTTHDGDRCSVYPSIDRDKDAIRSVLSDQMEPLKKCSDLFLGQCDTFLQEQFPSAFTPIDAREVALLLERISHDILPNIIPDGTLLGRPAGFQAILNASAVFRLNVLSQYGADDRLELCKSVQKLERFTAKALEVSYVQRRFNAKSDGE